MTIPSFHYVQDDKFVYRHVERRRNISRKGGLPKIIYYCNIKSVGFAFPGVCSPVEAGEEARTARRRGGDLPRGLRMFAQDDRTGLKTT